MHPTMWLLLRMARYNERVIAATRATLVQCDAVETWVSTPGYDMQELWRGMHTAAHTRVRAYTTLAQAYRRQHWIVARLNAIRQRRGQPRMIFPTPESQPT